MNGERLESSSGACGSTFWYSPPGPAGMDSSYMLISGIDCDDLGSPKVSLRFLVLNHSQAILTF